jgi:hypothetical protein
MTQLKRYFLYGVSILLLASGIGSLMIAYQAGVTYDVIENSLDRHVSQFLIEQATADIVKRELTFQNRLLWITGSLLLVSGVIMPITSNRKRRTI